MSYTTMHLVPRKGEITFHKEYRNSHLSAAMWWQTIASHYKPGEDGNLHAFGFDYFKDCYLSLDGGKGMERVWKLAFNEKVNPVHRTVLKLTFDKHMVQARHLPHLVADLGQFVEDFGTVNTGHARTIAQDISDLLKCPPVDLAGIAFTWTSVADDLWMVPDEVDDLRWYDISRDTGHVWLYDETEDRHE